MTGIDESDNQRSIPMPILRLAFATLLVGLFALSQSACSGTRVGVKEAESYNARPLKVYIPEGVSNAAAMRAAESGLTGRRWAVVGKSDDQITGELSHQRFDATVNIRIEDGSLVLYSDSTYTNPQTQQVEAAVPYGWLENLQKDIQKIIVYEGR
jgi:hypothetical protein